MNVDLVSCSTPTEWATVAWKSAHNSALVVRHGDDHTTFNRANASSSLCFAVNLSKTVPKSPATWIEKEFLRTGILPPVYNGTEVTVYHAGMCRAPIPNPYDVPTGIVAGDCPIEDECNLN